MPWQRGAPLGSRALRFAARLIDSLLLTPVYLIIYIPAIVVVGMELRDQLSDSSHYTESGNWVADDTGSEVLGMALAYYAIGLVASVGVLAAMALLNSRDGARRGQSLGKQWLGLRVVNDDGTPMTRSTAWTRECAAPFLISALTCGIGGLVDNLWPLIDSRKRRLVDVLANTIVVQAPTGSAAGPPPPPPDSFARVS